MKHISVILQGIFEEILKKRLKEIFENKEVKILSFDQDNVEIIVEGYYLKVPVETIFPKE
ncbi:MAG: hypothetical protein QXI58_01160 [Candidatus Micrarchaeia archaeon]